MGILSTIYGVVSGAAKAFTPKPEPPTQVPVQIQIVDGREKTREEQVRDWINGSGEAPSRVSRIYDNIRSLNEIQRGDEYESMQARDRAERLHRKARNRSDDSGSGISKTKLAKSLFVRGSSGGTGRKKKIKGSTQSRTQRGDPQVRLMQSGSPGNFSSPNFDTGFGSSNKKNRWRLKF